MSSIDSALANYNPSGFALENQQRSANIPLTQAQTAEAQARVPLTQAQVPLVQAQTQAADLENQQRQQSLKDYQIWMDAIGRNGGDPSKALNDPAALKMSGAGFINAQKTVIENGKNLAQQMEFRSNAAKSQQEIDDAENKYFGNGVLGLTKQPGGVTPVNLDAFLAQSGAISPVHKQEADQLRAQLAQDPTQAPAIAQRLLDASGVGRAAAKETSEQDLQASEVKKNAALQREAAANAAFKEAETNPSADLGGAIGAAKLDPDIAQNAKVMMAAAATRTEKIAALKDAVDKQTKRNDETNTALPAARAAIAAAEAQARIPAEIAARVGSANALNATGPELADVPLNERTATASRYEKSLLDLNSSAADASRIHSLINAAQQGNKAAPALVPIAELRGFLNRINGTELKSVSSQAGSLYDQIDGYIKGKTEGQPVSPAILQATDELASLQIKNAEAKHGGEVAAINKARGSKYKPSTVEDLGLSRPNTTGATGGISTPTTQQQYDAIPKGSQFRKPNDPKVYIKQ